VWVCLCFSVCVVFALGGVIAPTQLSAIIGADTLFIDREVTTTAVLFTLIRLRGCLSALATA